MTTRPVAGRSLTSGLAPHESNGTPARRCKHSGLAVGCDVDREIRIKIQQDAEIGVIPFHNHDPRAICVAQVLGSYLSDVFGVMGNGNVYFLDAAEKLGLRFSAVRHARLVESVYTEVLDSRTKEGRHP